MNLEKNGHITKEDLLSDVSCFTSKKSIAYLIEIINNIFNIWRKTIREGFGTVYFDLLNRFEPSYIFDRDFSVYQA